MASHVPLMDTRCLNASGNNDNDMPTAYQTRQSESGIKEGDKVRIIRNPKSYEDGWGHESTSTQRPVQVGQIGEIISVHYDNGFQVRVPNGRENLYWPYFVLEKVDPATGVALPSTPAVSLSDANKTVIIFNGKATLIGQFTKDELTKIMSSAGW